MNSSQNLLHKYTHQGDDAAFRELVRMHLNLVYAAALRVLQGNSSAAEDVVQATFTELARKAGTLGQDVILSGWLYRTAVHLAQRNVRAETRRMNREKEAVAMSALEENDQETWSAVAPELDAAMSKLSERERNALVLRFFEKQDLRGLGMVLGLTEDAAQKCVSRALDKLRGILQSRGLRSTVSVLAAVLMANGAQAAPAELLQRVPMRALAGAATAVGWLSRWKLVALATGLVVSGAALPKLWESRATGPAASSAPSSTTMGANASLPAAPAAGTGGLEANQSLKDLVTKAAQALHGGAQNITATSDALNLLGKIPLPEIRLALDEVAKVTDVGAQTLLYKYLLGRWAESHPNDAMAYARKQLPFACRVDGMQGILDAWAVGNPAAAIAYTSKASAVTQGNDALQTTLFRNAAQHDLAQAFAMYAALETPGDRSYALRGIMERVQDESHRQELLQHTAELSDPALRLQALRTLVERWADHDAPAAAGWILTNDSAYERSRLMDSLGLVWLQRDPKPAASWWFEHEPDAATLTKIVNVWAHQDPNQAGAWLNEHAHGSMADEARMTFARQVQEMDPESAFAWAESITTAELREVTVDHVFKAWWQREPAAASNFLNLSGWPELRRSRLQPITTTKP